MKGGRVGLKQRGRCGGSGVGGVEARGWSGSGRMKGGHVGVVEKTNLEKSYF